jgi:hypothetical protein
MACYRQITEYPFAAGESATANIVDKSNYPQLLNGI